MVVDWTKIKHFKPYETECRCGCGKNDPSHELMVLMDKFREDVNRPVHINSLCRCAEHNRNEGAEDTSSHVKSPTEAVDIEAVTKRHRFQTIRFFIEEGFDRLGIARGFIHGDLDQNKTGEITWLY